MKKLISVILLSVSYLLSSGQDRDVLIDQKIDSLKMRTERLETFSLFPFRELKKEMLEKLDSIESNNRISAIVDNGKYTFPYLERCSFFVNQFDSLMNWYSILKEEVRKGNTFPFVRISEESTKNVDLNDINYGDIKDVLKDYDQAVGDYPIKLFVKENGDSYSFKMTQPVPGQTQIAAELTLDEILKLNKVNTFKNKVFTFQKNGPNKGVILLKIIAFKK